MIGWAIETLVASSLLMLVVLALRGPVAARFGAHAAYLLWLLPALRMILPRIPEAATPVHAVPLHLDVAKLIAAAAARSGTPAFPQSPAMPTLPAMPQLPGATVIDIDWVMVGLIVWLVGAAVYLAWQLGRHHRFMTLALEHARPGFRRGRISVRLSPAITGPLAAGIFQRHILLPEDFAQRYSGDEQRLALEHELAHHRRGDLIANAAALIMLALHWFNPIAYWAYRAFRTDQELACDATVLVRAPSETLTYGSALIKSARAGMPAAATCALGPATELKRRMKMIAHATRGSRARRIAGQSLTGILVVAGLGLTASGGIAAPSKIAPEAAQPLFAATPKAHVIVIADRSGKNVTTTTTVTRQTGDTDAAAPEAPVTPVAPTPPAAAVAPVASVAPMAAMAPMPPMPPMPAMPPMAPALAAAADARAQAEAAKTMAASASAVATVASEAALKAVANMDIGKIIEVSVKQARLAVAQACGQAKGAVIATSNDKNIQHIAVSDCVDMASIDREVGQALREARDEIRNDPDIPPAIRANILSQLDRAAARTEKNSTH